MVEIRFSQTVPKSLHEEFPQLLLAKNQFRALLSSFSHPKQADRSPVSEQVGQIGKCLKQRAILGKILVLRSDLNKPSLYFPQFSNVAKLETISNGTACTANFENIAPKALS